TQTPSSCRVPAAHRGSTVAYRFRSSPSSWPTAARHSRRRGSETEIPREGIERSHSAQRLGGCWECTAPAPDSVWQRRYRNRREGPFADFYRVKERTRGVGQSSSWAPPAWECPPCPVPRWRD